MWPGSMCIAAGCFARWSYKLRSQERNSSGTPCDPPLHGHIAAFLLIVISACVSDRKLLSACVPLAYSSSGDIWQACLTMMPVLGSHSTVHCLTE